MSFSMLRRSVSVRSWLVLAAGLLAGFAHAGESQSALIPSYFYPGPIWTQALTVMPSAGQVMIINPRNGPGAKVDPNYQAAAKAARAAGVKVLGYVHTLYGERDLNAVFTDILWHFEWYQVDGIFLDEASEDRKDLAYYKLIADGIHSLDGEKMVVLNPGTYPAEEYAGIADIIVTAEMAYAKYKKDRGVPAWVAKYPASRFCHIVHGVSNIARMREVVQLSRDRNAGYVYVTDDSNDNPYDRLPKYWTEFTAELDYEAPDAVSP
jgi:hypothetical protein